MKVCSVPDCTGKVLSRGYCSRHYWRWHKHGDPEAGRTREGEVLEWLQAHVDHQGDECLTFPYAKNDRGYGSLKFEGHIIAASRAMCILAHGHPDDPSLVAAHSCGMGHEACVNPKHLRWATHAENAADLTRHREQGIRPPPPSGLDGKSVRDIVQARGREPQKMTAARHKISVSMVCRIQRGNRRAGVAL